MFTSRNCLIVELCRAYFAVSLLNVATELLDNSKQETVQILGCQTLSRFIYSQVNYKISFPFEKYINMPSRVTVNQFYLPMALIFCILSKLYLNMFHFGYFLLY